MENRVETAVGAFVLRISLGLLFFIAGLNKFMGGLAGAREGIVKMFGQTWLPGWSVTIFATVLPFMEVGIGLLLILGLFRVAGLVLGALLMVSLSFGMMVAQKNEVVSSNMFYVAMFAAALYTTRWDVIAADAVLFRRRGDVRM